MLKGPWHKEMKESQYIELSTGQKRRLHLALALSVIQMLFSRQITAGTWCWRTTISPYLEIQLKSQGKTIVFGEATIWPKLKPYVTALLFLNSGKDCLCGTPSLTDGLGRKLFHPFKDPGWREIFETHKYDRGLFDFIVEECRTEHIKYWIRVDRGTLGNISSKWQGGVWNDWVFYIATFKIRWTLYSKSLLIYLLYCTTLIFFFFSWVVFYFRYAWNG